MRLIDADDITIKLPFILGGKKLTQIFLSVKESLDILPTVDAIPIEWLKRWAENTHNNIIAQNIINDWEKERGDL